MNQVDTDNTDHKRSRSRAFYCRDCHIIFDSLPDGIGYDQAPCVQCGKLCMTMEFEQQEKERNRREATWYNLLLIPFSMLLSPFHLHFSHAHVPDDSSEARPPKPVTIATYDDRFDAEHAVRVLAQYGIEATLELSGAGSPNWFGVNRALVIELQVLPAAAMSARQILQESVAPSSPEIEPRALAEDEDIVCRCQECGETLVLPSHRRGKVETCRHCGN